MIAHFFVHWSGSDGGNIYNLYSGIGPFAIGMSFIGGLIGAYRRHNCHIKGCPWIGKMKVPGKEWVVCHKHHTDSQPTEQDLRDHMENYNGDSSRNTE